MSYLCLTALIWASLIIAIDLYAVLRVRRGDSPFWRGYLDGRTCWWR